MNPRRLLIPLLLLSGLLISACALGEMVQQTGSTPTQGAPTPEATTGQPGTIAPNLSSETQGPAPTPAPKVPEITLNNGGLDNYRNRLVLKFSGQDAQGSAAASLLEVMSEADKAHNASHRMARSEVQGQRPGSLDIYQTEQGVFLISSETAEGLAGCTRTAAENLASQMARAPSPADLIQGFGRGILVGKGDVINSATTEHYSMVGIKISFGTVESSSGDIWIEPETGLVVRVTGQAEGAFSLGGGASYGRVEWQYNFNKAAKAQIGLPQDCQTLADNDLPFPEQSGDPRQSGSELSLDTQTQPAQVDNFYRSELLKRGWTINTDAGGGSTFELGATKDDHTLHITITGQDKGARVTILRK